MSQRRHPCFLKKFDLKLPFFLEKYFSYECQMGLVFDAHIYFQQLVQNGLASFFELSKGRPGSSVGFTSGLETSTKSCYLSFSPRFWVTSSSMIDIMVLYLLYRRPSLLSDIGLLLAKALSWLGISNVSNGGFPLLGIGQLPFLSRAWILGGEFWSP